MSGFRTKLDYSNNRQIKQFEKTNTILSGGTVFGLPFNELTVGPNLDYSGVTNSYIYATSSFSGNNTTTIFNWFDANMQIAEYAISAITPTTSADTQELDYIFVGNNQATLDGNTFYVDYSGISFDIHVTDMVDLGSGNYSGTVEHLYIDFLSATSLDYQSRTIWIDNPEITRTDRLIITRNPQVNYVWTCIDSEGMGAWMPSSGSSTGSSANLVWTAGTNNSTAVLSGSTSVASGQYSVAEGQGTIASGYASHAEGDGSVASGTYGSHAEGYQTTSSGYSSHAEGSQTTASGNYSHAEGSNTTASGYHSHAEGYYTIASGDTSHAEGSGTTASGIASHAGGLLTKAIGLSSYAGGYSSITESNYSFVHSNKSLIFGGENSYILSGKENYLLDSDYSGILGGRYNNIGIGQAGLSINAENAFIGGGYTNTIYEGTINSSILGGSDNRIHKYSNNSSVIGGKTNQIFGSSIDSGIFVGTGNTIAQLAKHSAIIAGKNNSISGHTNSVIVGGDSNLIDFCLSNYYSPANEIIVGGGLNKIFSTFNSVIIGGSENSLDGRPAGIGTINSFILGSYGSSASTTNYSGIIGGLLNIIHPSDCSYISSSIIIGGERNEYNPSDGPSNGSGQRVTIIGGFRNKMSGETISDASIFGGVDNVYYSVNSTGGRGNVMVGGSGNTLTVNPSFGNQLNYATIIGGGGNNISSKIGSTVIDTLSSYSIIAGGLYNTITGSSYSFIGGGENNLISERATNSVILGGELNIIRNNSLGLPISSAIIAGSGNTIDDHNYSAILAGIGNTIHLDLAGTEGKSSETILGGGYNTISASTSSSIVGGTFNQIQNHTSSVILGGYNNKMLDYTDDTYYGSFLNNLDNSLTEYNTILGGIDNTLTGKTSHCSIIGGSGNTINGDLSDFTTWDSSIVGGLRNTILEGVSRSIILGGTLITATTSDHVYAPNIIINTGGTTSRLGVNTVEPESTIDAYGSDSSRLQYDGLSAGGQVLLSGATELPRFTIISNSGTTSAVGETSAISLGVRSWDDVTYTIYGKKGDAFIYGGIYTNGINIISNDGGVSSGEDYIRFFAGQSQGSNNGTNTADIHIQGTGATRGNVGFNTNSPTQKIDVNGNGRFRVIGSSASAGALHYTSDGSLTTNTSDERLKTNITTLTNALEKVRQLRGVKYNWLEEPNGDVRIGLIAQEVNNIIPELTFVNKNTEEQFMGVHYDNVVALLIEAVKELSSGTTISNNNFLETQTILAEDNNIDLNYNGTKETSVGGGLRILHAKGENLSAELVTDENGDFITNNDFKPDSLTIPFYKPTSSEDKNGNEGNITRDSEYLYIKTSNGWKRTKLESF